MPKFKKVLLVEDDHITVIICEKIIKFADFAADVVSVSNGQEAYKFLNSEAETNVTFPEIILLDLNMPVMNGWEFLERYADWTKGKKNIPEIYMLSSTVDQEEMSRAMQYPHVKGFISKPLTKEHLQKIDGV
jgi:CheY-like chemotaxis protein